MMRLLLTLALLWAATCQAAPLRQVSMVSCKDRTVELEVREHTWNVDGQMTFHTRAYFYDGEAALPAPTLVMQPGSQCRLKIKNSLSNQLANCSYHANYFHCPDTTNVHTHGLHVSPKQDNIDTHIRPGSDLTYMYDIPDNHLMGTHWYHAHHHGSTTLQANGGMAGFLLMEPAADYTLPADVQALYAQAPLLLQIHHINFAGTDQGTSEAFTLMDYQAVSDDYKTGKNGEKVQTVEPSPTFTTGLHNFFIVNGQYQPTVSMAAGEVRLFRFLYSGGWRIAELELSSAACRMVLVARDGVFQYTPYPTISAVVFAPGTRADVAIQCTEVGSVTAAFVPAASRDALGTENRASQAKVFDIDVTASGGSGVTAFPTSQADLPSYLQAVTAQTVSHGTKGVTRIELAVEAGNELINGVAFPGFDAPVESRYVESGLCLGRTYEFTIVPPGPPGTRKRQAGPPPAGGPGGGGGAPATGAHPYHQHVNHFQIMNLNGKDATSPDIIRLHEWRDVVPAYAPNGVTIRFTPHDFEGDTVLHCHILQHEDHGMMGLFGIKDCDPKPTPSPSPSPASPAAPPAAPQEVSKVEDAKSSKKVKSSQNEAADSAATACAHLAVVPLLACLAALAL